jgi:hypothetical protein
MVKNLLFSVIILISISSFAQQVKKVLFLGNSYTGVNDLPGLVDSITRSKGDSLIYDSNTPGGYTYQLHCSNTTSIAKINSNSWDYVILQEQSQLPSFPPSQVQTDVIPYADTLNQVIKANDSCTTTLFYMTWGRKNGDASNCLSYPPVCTYSGMQSRLRDTYLLLGQMFGEVCPAGMAWKRVRDLDSTINLYQPDESHPTIFGSYLVACAFYACIFHKSPIGATYVPAGISAPIASFLQAVADSTVFDSLIVWNIDTFPVHASFIYNNLGSGAYQFSNNSTHATTYFWDFGDGYTSNAMNPLHTYTTTGPFNVTLIVYRNCLTDTAIKHLNVSTGISDYQSAANEIFIYPVPAKDYIKIIFNMPEPSNLAEIYNTQGILMLRSRLMNGGKIDISNLSSGVYSIRVYRENKFYKSVRFVKQ